MSLSLGTFKFVLQTPSAKLLECRAGSVIVPAHDGQMGILRNHVPMLSKLGIGVLQVRDVQYERGRPGRDKFYLVDGGFVRISENNVTVLAYDIDSFEGLSNEDVDQIVKEAKNLLAGDKYSKQARRHDIEKASVIIQLAKTAGIIGKEGY